MIYVKDDNGHAWYFDGDRIKCFGDDSPDGGYDAISIEDGIEQLNRYGYITPPVEQTDEADGATCDNCADFGTECTGLVDKSACGEHRPAAYLNR